jgi:hypothetical protein
VSGVQAGNSHDLFDMEDGKGVLGEDDDRCDAMGCREFLAQAADAPVGE